VNFTNQRKRGVTMSTPTEDGETIVNTESSFSASPSASDGGGTETPQPDPHNVGKEQKDRKLGYSHIELHADNGGQSGIVHFSDGSMRGVRDFKEFNLVCRSLLDFESAVRFMDEVNSIQKEGKLQYLLPRNPDQPNPQDVDKENTETKLQYERIELSENRKWCKVYFVGGNWNWVNTFRHIEHNRLQMDDESAELFLEDIAKFKSQGVLTDLLSLEEVSAYEQAWHDREVKINELENQLQDLLLEERELQAEGLSYHTLANVVASHMLSGLNNSELDPIFIAMSNRGMTIRIVVDKADDDDDEPEVLQQVINPRNLISQDVGDKEERLRRCYNQVLRDLENIRK
jgi:hypothetical protein